MLELANIPQIDRPCVGGQIEHTGRRMVIVKSAMVKSLTYLFCFLMPLGSSSQIGLNVKGLFGRSDILEEQRISQDGMQASVEYHFRLKEYRVEFHPGIGYRFTWDDPADHGKITSFDLDLNTSIYPFDFEGDCDCPTFSKQGSFLQKGFFLEVAPGIAYQTLERFDSDVPIEELPVSTRNVIFKIGGAAGIDIGISDHFTITPMVSLTLLSSAEWEALSFNGSTRQLDDYSYLGAGIRLTYSADEKRRK
jgi:hypothetical protein